MDQGCSVQYCKNLKWCPEPVSRRKRAHLLFPKHSWSSRENLRVSFEAPGRRANAVVPSAMLESFAGLVAAQRVL